MRLSSTDNKITGYKYPFLISNDAYPTISGNDVSGCVFKGIGLQGTFYSKYTLGDYNKLPYQLSNSLYISGNTFTIPSGLSIDMQTFSINVNAKNSGVLVERSEAFLNASGVTFTGSSTGSGLIQYTGFLGTGQAEFWSGGTLDKCTFNNVRFNIEQYSNPKISNSNLTITSSVNAIGFMISGYVNSIANGFSTPELTSNKISGYKYPIVIANDAYPTISGNDVSGCVFKGIGLQGTFYSKYTLGDYEKLPYQLSSHLNVIGNTFTIPSGLSIDMQTFSINVNAKNSGVLVDRSDAFLNANGVTFTGSSTGSGLIQYTGFLGTGQAEFWSGGTLDKCIFKNTRFVFNDYSNPKFEQVQISGVAADAFTVNKTGKPSISFSDFYNISGFGIKNLGTNSIEAQNCYWGDTSGPYHATSNTSGKGVKVSDKVNFTPWASKPNNTIQDEVIIEKLYPVFKYSLNQNGSAGISIAMNLVGIGEAINAVGVASDIISTILKQAASGATKYAFFELIDFFPDIPKYVTCCARFNGTNLESPNSDFVFLAETEDQIQIGKPFTASYVKVFYDLDNSLMPPGVGLLKNYNVEKLASNYMTVYEAGYKLEPKIISPKLNITTTGIVNGYLKQSNKLFMILQNYRPVEYFLHPIFKVLPFIDMNFIAVDVTNQSTIYDVGSLVEISGQSSKISSIIKQEYEYWFSKKAIQYLSPTSIKLLNGKPLLVLRENTSLLSMYFTKGVKVVGLKFPEYQNQLPDIKFVEQNLSIIPKGSLQIGNNYTVEATVVNNGTIASEFSVVAFVKNAGKSRQIKQIDGIKLQPNEKRVIQFDWIPDNSMDIIWGKGVINLSATNSSPIEYNLSNNTIFSEFDLNLSDYYKYFTATGYCPVTLKVTAPDGQYIDINSNLINGAEYVVDDFNGDGYLDNRVFIPETIEGEYKVDVIPNEDAKPDDSYTLVVRANNQEIVFADSVKIQEIPTVPYVYIITSNKKLNESKDFEVFTANGQVYIRNNKMLFEEYQIDLFDVAGRLIYSKKKTLDQVLSIPINTIPLKNNMVVLRISGKEFNKSFNLILN